MSKATTENSPDETKTCPLCGGRVFWFPISNYWGCEHCKNTFNRYTVFPDKVKKTSASAVGNAAALREACQKMRDLLMLRGDGMVRCVLTWDEFNESQKMLRAALSAPARNCDLPLVVDGPANNNADKAWLVFKYHNPDAYFDVPGLLRCIEWLLAPATERKGGAK